MPWTTLDMVSVLSMIISPKVIPESGLFDWDDPITDIMDVGTAGISRPSETRPRVKFITVIYIWLSGKSRSAREIDW